MDQPLEGETTLLTPEQAQRLNQDEHTTVLEYEYDTPERILPMTEVLELLQYTQEQAQHLRDKSDLAPPAVRATLTAEHDGIRLFSTTHPTIFAKATDPSTPPAVLAKLQQMIAIRARQERGELSDIDTAAALEKTLQS